MNKKTVLIADKEIEIKKELQLEKSNLPLFVSYVEGNNICDCISHNRYDLVVLDNERLADTLENLIYTIKKLSPKTRIIVTTAKGDIASYIRLISLGVNEYVYKPVSPNLFNQIVQSTLC